MTVTTSTSTERNTQIVLRFVDALDRKQFDQAEAMLSPDFQLYFSGQQLNKAQTMAMARSVYEAFADFTHEVQETLAVDDRVVVRFIDRGTHTGDFEGVPPSGRQIALGQISIVRVAEGRLLEIREEVDMMVLMQQIGALPAQSS